MRLNQILHPEVVLGRRGSENNKRMYAELLKRVRISKDGIEFKNDGSWQEKVMADNNTRAHLSLCKKFVQDSGKVYYIPDHFLKALSKLDRKLPTEYFPDKFLGYFHFAPGVLSDDEGVVEGGYVYIGPASELGIVLDESDGVDTKAVMLVYLNPKRFGGDITWSTTRFTFPLHNKSVSRLVSESVTEDNVLQATGDIKDREKIYRALVNAVLYVNSQDPEVMKLRPITDFPHSKRSKYKELCGGNSNECTLPVTLLNWGYGGSRQYSVDSTVVQTHLRWQPCGPERSKVKLIWVSEHERHYKRDTDWRSDAQIDTQAQI